MRCINLDEVYPSLVTTQQKSAKKFIAFARRLANAVSDAGLSQKMLPVIHGRPSNAQPIERLHAAVEQLESLSRALKSKTATVADLPQIGSDPKTVSDADAQDAGNVVESFQRRNEEET